MKLQLQKRVQGQQQVLLCLQNLRKYLQFPNLLHFLLHKLQAENI